MQQPIRRPEAHTTCHARPAMDISVVVPAYNAARTVAETLESILAQSLPPREVVVVDDGSRDGTLEVLRTFGDRVKVKTQPNSGVSTTRNRGVEEAAGEWIAFCDADDVWHPDKLRLVAAVAASHPVVDLLFHDFWVIAGGTIIEARATHSRKHSLFPLFKEGLTTMREVLPLESTTTVRDVAPPFSQVTAWFGDPFRWLLFGAMVQPSTVVMKRSTFLRIGGFDSSFRYAEDGEFFLRAAKKVRFLWIDASLTGYRRAPGTLLSGNMLPTLEGALKAVVKHGVDDPAVYQAHRRWVNRAVARRFARVGYFCLTELRRPEARQYARTALSYRALDPLAWTVLTASLVPASFLRAARRAKSSLGAPRHHEH